MKRLFADNITHFTYLHMEYLYWKRYILKVLIVEEKNKAFEKQRNGQNMPFWNKNWHFWKAISNCF